MKRDLRAQRAEQLVEARTAEREEVQEDLQETAR